MPTPKLKPYKQAAYPQIADGQANYIDNEFGKVEQSITTIVQAIVLLDPVQTPLVSAANDTAAAAAGVPLHGLYQTSGTVKVRLV